LENNKTLLAQTENEYRAARSRRHEFEANLPQLPEAEPLLDPLREAITVESQRLRAEESRRASMVMRSPIEGQVTRILCRQGQSVRPGEPIVTITDRTVRNIVTYLASADDRTIRENSPVLVSSLDRPGQVSESLVTRVGGSIEILPERLWVGPATPGYGRAVVIAALPNMGLRPGELLNIRFLDE
jgi:multidrug resistance efflux pump